MGTNRLEAFTDGVVAIIITIMVLEIKAPAGVDLASLQAIAPILFAYVLSFVNVGIFWNNHHHMLHAAKRINGRALWSNLFLLFWLSLIPLVIRWMDETHFAALPTAAYGAVLVGAAAGYQLLARALVAHNGKDSTLARAVGVDIKAIASLTLYAFAVPLAFVSPWISISFYVLVAALWFIPDRRIETRFSDPRQ